MNRLFAGIVSIIVLFGFVAFLSASFGLLSRTGGPSFSSVLVSQLCYGLIPGIIAAYFFSRVNYILWRRMAVFIFLFAVVLNLLLLIPSISLEHGGATRWLVVGGMTFQPSEFLKIAFVIYLASWLSGVREKVKEARFGIIPFVLILAVSIGILILQRDTDTAVIITLTALAVYFVAGARFRDLFIVLLCGGIGLTALFFIRPYLMDRLLTFLDPTRDVENSGYQVSQSLVAIGSGEMFGRGFGQSVQKFSRLPEPIGDSIYAVIGEEFGFLGAALVVIFLAAFALAGIRISIRSPDSFGRLLVLAIVILITTQSFVNSASMLGLIPLSGIPLVFVSHGGTSLLAALAAVGIVLNVSRYT